VDAQALATIAAVRCFDEAFGRHDVEAVMAAMTDDCVFENTYPPPDGERHVGPAAVRAAWEDFFRSSPDAVFETEETFPSGDRCVVRWRYRWRNVEGEGHVRGVDIFRVRDGKVAEKLSYVKG
jgi:ketosteroid isomerase-like protein